VATYTPSSSGTVTVEITSSDADATNNTQNIAVSASNAVAPGTNVTFEVKTDNYGSETTWKLFNPDGTIFSQGGPYTNTTSPQPHTYNWALDDLNCYRLEVYDAYGDGMCCSYGQGYYKVMVNGATVLQGGQFSSQDIKPFSTNAALSVGENNALDRSLNVYPNPSTGLVNVEYALEQGTPVQVTVTDVLGKTVLDRTLRPANGTQRETIDMGNLSNGIYLMKLTAGGLQAARTITLSK
jgi:hypothetical protein